MIEKIHVEGIVQGVGFRPFVFRLASKHGLNGWVNNASDGVHILAEGEVAQIDSFCRELKTQKPPAAYISDIHRQATAEAPEPGFSICESAPVAGERTLISPDLATCPDCLSELFDAADRRQHYPFINCTNCGPRFTIIERLPYDRAFTTMTAFAMCELCAEEYSDPANRRFHAQPNACFDCGPRLEYLNPTSGERLWGQTRELSDELIARSAELLLQGGIVAMKGLGGYHLVCDATNEQAVARLRERKQRPRKPLAVMFSHLEGMRQYCELTQREVMILTSPATPIVLVQHTRTASVLPIAPSVAGGLTELGVMLPATPAQHVLLCAAGRPLVMTSGNVSEEPIIADDRDAERLLAHIADAFIMNNRPIRSSYDDSVVRVLPGRSDSEKGCVQLVRRARGYAPTPLAHPLMAVSKETVLAVGPEQKGTFCFTAKEGAFVSQHLGDLDSVRTFENYLKTVSLYEQLFDFSPSLLACDLHPNYRATRWAHEQAKTRDIPCLEVQHHHAHIAAVLAENLCENHRTGAPGITADSEVIGIALDGTGYGVDGTIWGGEVLIATLAEYGRFAHLEPFRLPGGAQAIKHPLRAAYALLVQHELTEHPGAKGLKKRLGHTNAALIERMLERKVNAPLTSSAGRLFDAVSSLLGIGDEASYDGEPACLLEATMGSNPKAVSVSAPMPAPMPLLAPELKSESELMATPVLKSAPQVPTPLVISPQQLILTLLNGLEANMPRAELAGTFHRALLQMLVETAQAAREHTSLTTVALSGGVFNNRFVATQLPRMLEEEGFTVLTHRLLPPNDGCISYGQAVVACARLNKDPKAATLGSCV